MKVTRSFLIAIAVVVSTHAALAQSPAPPASAGSTASVKTTLAAQNNSGETGTATLAQSGSDVLVTVQIAGEGTVAQPIHIHKGSCAKLDPSPAYPLTTVQNGSSVTTLKNMKLGDLETGGYAINVHKSTSDIGTYVACGDIPKTAAM
jgi:hypothetical protein